MEAGVEDAFDLVFLFAVNFDRWRWGDDLSGEGITGRWAESGNVEDVVDPNGGWKFKAAGVCSD